MTPGTPAGRVHPARQRLIGIITGVRPSAVVDAPLGDPARDRAGQVEARVAIYATRTSSEPLAEIPLTWPAAGAFQPTLGTRLAVTLEPIE